MLVLTVCKILIFITFDLENLGQGHEVEKMLLTSFDNYKCRTSAFFVSSHSFPDIIYYMIPIHFVTLKI